MEGEESEDASVSPLFSPKRAKLLESVPYIVEKGKAIVEDHYNSSDRVKTVSAQLLEFHCEYARLLAETIRLKAIGKDDEALEYAFKLGAQMMHEITK